MALVGSRGLNTFDDASMDKLKREFAQLERQASNLQSRLASFGVRRHEAVFAPNERVRFRNDHTSEVPAFAVMRVTGATKLLGESVVTIARPNTSFNRLYLVNTETRVAANGTGWGTWLFDAGRVLYESGTPAVGESWGPADGQWSLKKWRYGFTIIGNNTASALTTVAIQDWVNGFLCKSNEAFTASGDTGAVSVYDGNQADITGTDVSGCINRTSVAWDSGTWGKATWLGGNWFVEPWDCPA